MTLGRPEPETTDLYYSAIGRVIARAAEAEAGLASVAVELIPEADAARIYGSTASKAIDLIRVLAYRWSPLDRSLHNILTAAEEGFTRRNWVAHSWSLIADHGMSAQLEKPYLKRDRTSQDLPPWQVKVVTVPQLYEPGQQVQMGDQRDRTTAE